MADLNIAGAPPWLIPAVIVHLAMALVLLVPALRAFHKSGTKWLHALWLFLPIFGLVAVATLMMLRVMPVASKPRLLALLVVVPLVNVVFLWVFAFGAWSEGGTPKPGKDRARRKTKPAPDAGRATPTLTGAGTGDAEEAARSGMVEPTLHAGGATMANPAVKDAPDPAPSGDAGEMTLHPSASAPAPAQLSPDQTSAEETDTGDRTIVAGAARSSGSVQADPAPKGRTKVAARTGDTAAGAKETTETGFDLVGSQTEDVYDEDGEPLKAAAAQTGDGAAGPALDKPETARPQSAPPADIDEERALRGKGITEDDLALAKGVLQDLEQGADDTAKPAAAASQDPTESPVLSELPLTDVVPDRVWLVQGVNARAANIEASIREEDVSRSVTGILVGRSNRADFIIDDESVSRNHARFVYLDGALHVEDLDSMNGTWVDGEKLEANDPQPVRRNSDVEFGKIRLDVREIDASQD